MADEDSEARRMSEIADAINTILQNDAPAPDPVEASDPLKSGSADSETPIAETPVTEKGVPDGTEPADVQNDTQNDENGNDLEAAIAAEFADTSETETSDTPPPDTPDSDTSNIENEDVVPAADDPFGPPVTLGLEDAPTDRPTGASHGIASETAQKNSDLSLLSLRMQETLSDLQSGKGYGDGTSELLQDMKLARAQVMADVRHEIENLAEATRDRQAMIHEEMRQLEAQSQLVRDTVEIQLIKLETALDELHQKYFKNAEAERTRMDRYREFLQFLLEERGL
tara:strand:- start:652 stop:1503 length:852 start_codon:yes stop_codon:yes gene_type:complete